MTLDQFLALCKRAGFLDSLRNVVDAVDQLPVTVVLALHLQGLELRGRIDALMVQLPTGTSALRG